jgi:hypothetical protein
VNPAYITAIISLLGVLVVGFLVPAYLLTRATRERREDQTHADEIHRADRDAEWDRQDKIAARAAKATADLAESQKKLAARADEATGQLLTAAAEESTKLDTIHRLVNSALTAAMQAEHDAVLRELAMMREVMELRRAGGTEPGAATLAAIDATETKLAELAAALATRAEAQMQINADPGTDPDYRAKPLPGPAAEEQA